MAITIRRASSEDLAAILVCHQLVHPTEDVRLQVEKFNYRLSGWPYLAHVAPAESESEGNRWVYGYVVAMMVEGKRQGKIEHIAVLPSHRRQGLGRRLLTQCHNTMMETNDAVAAALDVRSDNHPAVELFQSIGYVTTKVIRDSDDYQHVEGNVMVKLLRPVPPAAVVQPPAGVVQPPGGEEEGAGPSARYPASAPGGEEAGPSRPPPPPTRRSRRGGRHSRRSY